MKSTTQGATSGWCRRSHAAIVKRWGRPGFRGLMGEEAQVAIVDSWGVGKPSLEEMETWGSRWTLQRAVALIAEAVLIAGA
jgi:hypothetical protein